MHLKEAPPQYAKMLERFGKNRYGQNLYRLIWAPSRMRIFGGYWDDIGKHEYRLVPKYGPTPQWALEVWRAPVIYGGPEIWERQTMSADGWLTCGPFPAHGDFECLNKFSAKNSDDGGILPEPGLILYLVMEQRLLRTFSEAHRKSVYEDEAHRKEQRESANFDDMWTEAQLSRNGLSIGAGGAFNKQQEIDDYARRIERAQAYVDARRMRPGFRQQ